MRTVKIVAILASWRTPDNRWIVDRLYSEDADWRLYDEGERVAELRGGLDVLAEHLGRRGVALGDLIALGEGDDPWSE
jgi:hypothetical protein